MLNLFHFKMIYLPKLLEGSANNSYLFSQGENAMTAQINILIYKKSPACRLRRAFKKYLTGLFLRNSPLLHRSEIGIKTAVTSLFLWVFFGRGERV